MSFILIREKENKQLLSKLNETTENVKLAQENMKNNSNGKTISSQLNVQADNDDLKKSGKLKDNILTNSVLWKRYKVESCSRRVSANEKSARGGRVFQDADRLFKFCDSGHAAQKRKTQMQS